MYQIPVCCPRCHAEIKTVSRIRKLSDFIKSGTLCKQCREDAILKMRERERSESRRLKNSKRMKDANPMSISPITRAKVISTKTGIEKDPKDYEVLKKFRKTETREELSERMKRDNPMHNKESVEKMKSTIARRIKDGQLIYKRGPTHHLWKGNRDFNNSCRRDLYPAWVFPILQRDNFRCTMCGSSKDLQVHHLKPLRDFINEIKIKYNIEIFTDYSAEELQPYVNEVVANHKLDDGITVCMCCHKVIDDYYHTGSRHED